MVYNIYLRSHIEKLAALNDHRKSFELIALTSSVEDIKCNIKYPKADTESPQIIRSINDEKLSDSMSAAMKEYARDRIRKIDKEIFETTGALNFEISRQHNGTYEVEKLYLDSIEYKETKPVFYGPDEMKLTFFEKIKFICGIKCQMK